jgi:hypothetical protein
MAAPKAQTLAEMQAAFQRALMGGDDEILGSLLDSSRTNREVLFGVYRHAYITRLIEVVRTDHRLLHTYLGDEAFEKIARAYIAARPSRNQNARWFSRGLPEFLSERESEHPEVAELAALERIVNDAFDSPDVPLLTISDLTAIPPDEWANLSFELHPSCRRLDLATNAYAVWAALKDDATPPSVVNLEEAERIIGWRRDVTPMLRRLEYEEAMLWNEAGKGIPFGTLCELVALFDDPDGAAMRAAQYLKGWIVDGMLSKPAAGCRPALSTPIKTGW